MASEGIKNIRIGVDVGGKVFLLLHVLQKAHITTRQAQTPTQ